MPTEWGMRHLLELGVVENSLVTAAVRYFDLNPRYVKRTLRAYEAQYYFGAWYPGGYKAGDKPNRYYNRFWFSRLFDLPIDATDEDLLLWVRKHRKPKALDEFDDRLLNSQRRKSPKRQAAKKRKQYVIQRTFLAASILENLCTHGPVAMVHFSDFMKITTGLSNAALVEACREANVKQRFVAGGLGVVFYKDPWPDHTPLLVLIRRSMRRCKSAAWAWSMALDAAKISIE